MVAARQRGLKVRLRDAGQSRGLRGASPGAAAANGARQQRLLTEVLTRRQAREDDLAALFVTGVDLHGAFEDDVHRVARVALVEQHVARPQRRLPRGGGERVQAHGVESPKQTTAGQRVGEVDQWWTSHHRTLLGRDALDRVRGRL